MFFAAASNLVYYSMSSLMKLGLRPFFLGNNSNKVAASIILLAEWLISDLADVVFEIFEKFPLLEIFPDPPFPFYVVV